MRPAGLHPATRGFDSGAERYERARPGYPDEAVDWLVAQLGVSAGARLLDVGAGTGKLTRPLLARGLRVVAVEPVAAMRAQLERTTPGAEVLAAQAEALPLAGGAADGIVAGQAFHWFATMEALAELARVLRPDGRLGLIWNRRDDAQPLQAAIEALIAPHRAGTPAHESGPWSAVFTPAAPFAPVAEQRFLHVQRLDAETIAERVLSTSVIALLRAPEQAALAARVRALVAEHGAELRYVTEVFVYARA